MNPCHIDQTFLSPICGHGVQLPKGVGAFMRFGNWQTQVVFKGDQGSSSSRVSVGISHCFTLILGYDCIHKTQQTRAVVITLIGNLRGCLVKDLVTN